MTEKIEGEYYSCREMELNAQRKFVDPLLYKAVCWLTDENLFKNALEPTGTNVASLNVCCDIITESTSIWSPKHLGLAVHLYHEYHSRELVEDLYNLGHCISYTELRCFLTSAAIHATSTQTVTPSGAIVPRQEITPKDEGGTQVSCVADNWDHNEHTVDGKRTTHAMTSILVSPNINNTALPRIPRVAKRTLDAESVPGYVTTFILFHNIYFISHIFMMMM